MSGFYREAVTVTARKVHSCTACFHEIVVGESHKTQTGVWDEKAFRSRFHEECFEALCECGDDEFSPGSFDPPERLLDPDSKAACNQSEVPA